MAPRYDRIQDAPVVLGRKGRIRYAEESATPFLRLDQRGALANYTWNSWKTISVPSGEYTDLSVNMQWNRIEATTRKMASRNQTGYKNLNINVVVEFNVFHYLGDTAKVTDGLDFPLIDRLPMYIRKQASSGELTALAFCEDDRDTTSGLRGNFFLDATKQEPMGGLQTWSVRAVASGFIDYFENESF